MKYRNLVLFAPMVPSENAIFEVKTLEKIELLFQKESIDEEGAKL